MLLYNIDFECVALVFVTTIYIFHRLRYKVGTVLNRQFRVLEAWAMVMIATDILSAVTISYYASIPRMVNMLSNSANFCSVVILGYYFAIYIKTTVSDDGKRAKTPVNLCICIAYLITAFANLFTGFLFDFGPDGYYHGPLYLVSLAAGYYYVLYSAVLIFMNRRKMSKMQLFSTGSYVVLMLVSALFQVFVFSTSLFSGVAICIVIVIILFSLETPDYLKLQSTIKELETAKNEAETAKEKAEEAEKKAEEAQDEAERASLAKSEFLARMSHEIRTPINAIMGMNEMVLRESGDKDIRFYSTNIKNSSETLLAIVNEILDLSRVESGRMDIVNAAYSTAGVVRDVASMMDIKAQDKGLKFILEADENLPSVLVGDETRIRQVALNILNNSVKYTKTGSVKFKVGFSKTDDKNIKLTLASIDTGIGIKEEDMDRLFKNFERLELEHNKNIEGTGLGLAITDRLVALMGGHIKVESVYGQGSTFTIELPQEVADFRPVGKLGITVSDNTEDAEKAKAEAAKAVFTAPGAKVLVVDDNKINMLVITNLLKRTLVQVDSAMSGAECLEKLAANRYDIVFLDHMMPEMDGVETLQKFREGDPGANADTVFVVLTANAIAGSREYYMGVGFDDYLSKPVSGVELEGMLAKYLEGSKE